MKTAHFNFSRLQYLIRRQTVLNIHSVLTSAVPLLGVLFVLTVYISYFTPQEIVKVPGIHILAFFIAGFIFTSKIFSELHDPMKGYFYLTLPVSNLERLAGSWLLSSPLYIVGFGLFTFLMILLTSLISGTPLTDPEFSSFPYLKCIVIYLVLQPVFLLGACYFRKKNFSKTLTAILLFFISIGLFVGLISYFLFMQIAPEIADFHYKINGSTISWEGESNALSDTLTSFLYYLLGPFMLLVSYFRLKERQL